MKTLVKTISVKLSKPKLMIVTRIRTSRNRWSKGILEMLVSRTRNKWKEGWSYNRIL